jgi:hypothetical protein
MVPARSVRNANATARAIIERGLTLLGYEVGVPAHYRKAAALDAAAAGRPAAASR